MGHRMHQRPSWNYCTYRLISLAFISGSIVLYASYMCVSLIYCLNHVECFRFFLPLTSSRARGTYKLQTTSAVHVLQATTMTSVSSILRKRCRVSMSCHTRDWRNHQVWSKFTAGLQPAFDLLSTCLRHDKEVLPSLVRHCGTRCRSLFVTHLWQWRSAAHIWRLLFRRAYYT